MSDKNFSDKHYEFVKAAHRKRVLIQTSRFLILGIFIAVWEICAQIGVIDPFIFSSPSRIFVTIGSMTINGTIWEHIGVTTFEAVAGFLLSTIVGTLIAIVLWWFPTAAKTLDPYLVILNAVPKIAMGPILIVWLGANISAIIMIAVLVSVFVTITSVLGGFNSISAEKLMLMKSLGASKSQTLRMVVLPASVPTIVSALKLNVGMAWVGVIVGEFLVSRAGLGYLAVYGGQVFKLDIVMTAAVILCALAAAMYMCVAWFEKRVSSGYDK